MRTYTAYGLRIQSELALPELSGSDGPADIAVRFAGAMLVNGQNGEAGTCQGTAESIEVRWPDVAHFAINSGREVLIHPVPGIDDQTLRTFLLGPVLGTLLRQRGCLVLHASGVAGPGGAVLFLGECGWGKSTTAAALHQRGWQLLTDDVAAFDPHAPLHVLPGFPRCKLRPDATRSLGLDPASLPTVHPQIDKRDYRIDQGFHNRPLALDRLYILAEGPTLDIALLAPVQAFIETVRHRYGNRVLDITNSRGLHFQQVDQLIRQIPVYRLSRPRRLDTLAPTIEAVERHFQASCSRDGGRIFQPALSA